MIKMTVASKLLLQRNRNLPAEISNAFRKTAYQGGKILLSWIRQDMKQPKTGRVYKSYFGVKGKYKQARFITASAPSETPAIRTGNFRKSIDFTVIGNTKLEWGSGKGTATNYARALEFGTQKMQARQPLQRSMRANDGAIKAMSIANIKKTIFKNVR